MSPEIPVPAGVVTRTFAPADQDLSHQRPLVMINGIGAGVDNWGQLPQLLQRNVLAVDVSHAELCRRRPSMPRYGRVLMQAITGLGHEQFDLLGVSWGGALAQEVVKLNANRVGKLVLAATLPGWMSVPPKFTPAWALQSSDRSSDRYRSMLGKIYGGDARINPSLLSDIGVVRRVDDEAYVRQKRAILLWRNSLFSLAHIKNSTLIMAGADDPITRPANALLMSAVMPNSQLHIVSAASGGGHLFLHTRPRESAAVIIRFLDSPANDRPVSYAR